MDGTAVGVAVGTLVAMALLAVFVRRRSSKREEVFSNRDPDIHWNRPTQSFAVGTMDDDPDFAVDNDEAWNRPIQKFTVEMMNESPELTFDYEERWNRPTQQFTVVPRGDPS